MDKAQKAEVRRKKFHDTNNFAMDFALSFLQKYGPTPSRKLLSEIEDALKKRGYSTSTGGVLSVQARALTTLSNQGKVTIDSKWIVSLC